MCIHIFHKKLKISRAFYNYFSNGLFKWRKAIKIWINSENFTLKALLENLGHNQLILLVTMIFNWKNDRSMIGFNKCESLNGFYDLLKRDWRSWCVTMLDNGPIAIIMDINLNASQSILKINQVSFSPTTAKQLIPC